MTPDEEKERNARAERNRNRRDRNRNKRSKPLSANQSPEGNNAAITSKSSLEASELPPDNSVTSNDITPGKSPRESNRRPARYSNPTQTLPTDEAASTHLKSSNRMRHHPLESSDDIKAEERRGRPRRRRGGANRNRSTRPNDTIETNTVPADDLFQSDKSTIEVIAAPANIAEISPTIPILDSKPIESDSGMPGHQQATVPQSIISANNERNEPDLSKSGLIMIETAPEKVIAAAEVMPAPPRRVRVRQDNVESQATHSEPLVQIETKN